MSQLTQQTNRLATVEPLETRRMLADVSGQYGWAPLKIGGGGYVTGIQFSSVVPGLVYARTDVGGAYRLDPGTSTWKQLLTTNSLPAAFTGDEVEKGVESIAVGGSSRNPADQNVVFIASQNRIFRSENKGETWADTTAFDFVDNANGIGRTFGERLAVDPRRADVVYAGSISKGLWQTRNSGGMWTQVPLTTIPVGTANYGVTNIVVDKNSPATTDGRTSVVFVTVHGGGVYRSADGGDSWTSLSPDTTSGPGPVRKYADAELSADGTLWVTCKDGLASNNIWKWTSTGGWVNASFSSYGFQSLALDPTNAQRAVVFIDNGAALFTINGGANWNWTNDSSITATDVPWLAKLKDAAVKSNDKLTSLADAQFDPFNTTSPTIWAASGTGVYTSSNLYDWRTIGWTSINAGIEEVVPFDVIAAPGGTPVTAVADVTGFKHDNPDVYPAKPTIVAGWNNNTDLAYDPSDPSYIVALAASYQVGGNTTNLSSYSIDGGAKWTKFASLTAGTHPTELRDGNIAVGISPAGDVNGKNMVWVPANLKQPYFSENGGATWTKSTTFPSYHKGGGIQNGWENIKSLVSDSVRPNTFYHYLIEDPGNGWSGRLYRSIDSTDAWTVSAVLPVGGYNSTLVAAPGQQGDLWFVHGPGGWGNSSQPADYRLYHLTNADNNNVAATVVSGLAEVYYLGFGKNAPNASYPTLYAYGKTTSDAQAGYYRGTYNTATRAVAWDLIGLSPMGYFGALSVITGDMNTYGDIYVGTGGQGFIHGRITNFAPTVARPASASTNPVTGTSATLSVLGADDGGEQNLTYTWASNGASPGTLNFSSNGTNAAKSTVASFGQLGTYNLRVTISDGTLSTTSDVTVVVNPTLTTITVTPAIANVRAGSTQTYLASPTDQFNNPMSVPITWSTTGATNSISPGGVFTPGNTTGLFTVTATSGAVGASVSVNVNASIFTGEADIGAVGLAGSSLPVSGGVYTLNGSGVDIFGTADGFHYVYKPFSGDGEIVARVTGVQNTNVWAKAGLMFRESLAAEARHASVFVTPGSGVSFQRRINTGGTSGSNTVGGVTAPQWVKLVRTGDVFTAYRSADGVTWSIVGGKSTIATGAAVYVGLALTSHNNTVLTSATFDNVALRPLTNLSLSATAVATSTRAWTTAGNAIDGNTSTLWASTAAGAQSITIDLLASRDLRRVTLKWGTNFATAFQVQFSATGSTWTNLLSTATGTGAGVDLTGVNVAARYVRIHLSAGALGSYEVRDVGVFG